MPWNELNDILKQLGSVNVEYKPGPGGQDAANIPAPQVRTEPPAPQGTMQTVNQMPSQVQEKSPQLNGWDYKIANQALASGVQNKYDPQSAVKVQSPEALAKLGLNARGEKLPDGAKGWTPYGDPYFGGNTDLGGEINKLGSIATGGTAGQGETLFNTVGTALDDFRQWLTTGGPASSPEALKKLEEYKQARDAQKAANNNAEQPGLSFGGVVDAAVTGALDFANNVPKLGEQATMALAGSGNSLEKQFGGPQEKTPEQVKAEILKQTQDVATSDTTPLGEIVKGISGLFGQQSPFAQSSSEYQAKLNDMANIGAAQYNAAPKTFSDYVMNGGIQDSWNAGQLMFTAATDGARKLEEYKQRVRAGEDPGLVAMELENPLSEAVGMLVYDMLIPNPVGLAARGVRSVARMADAEKAVGVAEEVATALGKEKSIFSWLKRSDVLDEAIGAVAQAEKDAKAAEQTMQELSGAAMAARARQAEAASELAKAVTPAEKAAAQAALTVADNVLQQAETDLSAATNSANKLRQSGRAEVLIQKEAAALEEADRTKQMIRADNKALAGEMATARTDLRTGKITQSEFDAIETANKARRAENTTKLQEAVLASKQASKEAKGAARTARTFIPVDPNNVNPAAKALNDATAGVMDLRDRVASGLSASTSKYSFKTLSARIHNLSNTVTDTVGLLYSGRRADQAGLLTDIQYLAMLASENPDEVLEATAYALSPKNVNGAILLSENGMKTGLLMRKLIGETADGALDFEEFGKLIGKADKTEARAVLFDRLQNAVEELYPASITKDMWTTKVHNFLQGFGYDKAGDLNKKDHFGVSAINSFLSNVYMGLSPAFAARNFTTNLVGIFTDEGPDALQGFSRAANEKYLLSRLGHMPAMAVGYGPGAKLGVEAALDPGVSPINGLKDKLDMRKLSGKFEEDAAVMVMRTALQRVEDQMWQWGKAIPQADELLTAGFTQEEVNHLANLFKVHGNPTEALAAFKAEYANGIVNPFRTLDALLDPADARLLRDLNLHVEIEQALTAPGATVASVTQAIETQMGKVEKLAQQSRRIANSINTQSFQADIFDVLHKLGTDDLHIQAATDYVNANQHAINVANGALTEVDNLIAGLDRTVLDDASRDQLRRMTTIARNDINQSENAYRTTKNALDNKVRNWEEAIRQAVDKKGNNVIALIDQAWQDLGMAGASPTQTTGNLKPRDLFYQFKDAAWRYVKETERDAGNLHRDTVFQIVNDAVAQFQTAVPGKYQADLLKRANQQYVVAQYFDDLMRQDEVRPILSRALRMNDNAMYARGIAIQNRLINTTSPTNDAHLLDIINGVNRPGAAANAYTDLASVPPKVAAQALTEYTNELAYANAGLDFQQMQAGATARLRDLVSGTFIPSPAFGPQPMLPQQMYAESLDGIRGLLKDKLLPALTDKFDTAIPTYGRDMQALDNWMTTAARRWNEVQQTGLQVANASRKFTLLDYGDRNYLDTALQYIFPYQFWYSRSYMNWAQRLAFNPEVISAYANYRDALGKINAGAPDYYRYNVNTNQLLGLHSDNPFYISFDQILNPMNGLTGVDYNDPKKRVDALTSFVDGIGKYGPSVWTPIQWALAAYLMNTGQKDAAARWAGRFAPVTSFSKTLITKAAPNAIMGRNEIDPWIWMFQGGLDMYDEKQIKYALGEMYNQGQIDYRTYIQAVSSRGDDPATQGAWRQAEQLANDAAFGTRVSSFFVGGGYRLKNQQAQQIEQMDGEIGRLIRVQKNNFYTPDEYNQMWKELRAKYPMMDGVLLGRKAGNEQLDAYSYNVLARIPPARTDDLSRAVGLDYGLISKFYDAKGDTANWAKADRDKLHAAMGELGAILNLPDNPTLEEWNAVKTGYKQMLATLDKQVPGGKTAYETYNDLYSSKGSQAAYDFADTNPAYYAYKNLKQQMVLNDPLLARYYGSVDDIEKMQKSMMYDALNARFPNAQELTQAYNDTPTEQRKTFLAKNPELKKYWDAKAEYEKTAAYLMDKMGQTISRLAPPKMPTYTAPANPSLGQANAMKAIDQMGQSQASIYNRSYADWVKTLKLSPATQNALTDNLLLGKKLSNAAQSNLEYAASKAGIPYALMMQLLSGAATQR